VKFFMSDITTKFAPSTIQNIVNLYNNGHLNLSPGFQRDSVWSERDRQKLIESILRKYPIPAVFFWRRQDGGEICYDVIDGKQRIESILMFVGKIRGERFSTRVQLPGDDERDWVDWNWLRRNEKQHLLTGYEIPKRNQFLTKQGIKVLRFWNHQLRNEPEAVRFEIWYALMERTGRRKEISAYLPKPAPSPQPSPPLGAREAETPSL
jgi:uncharacterized protein DUF262/uncharacterized protein DUF559